jgi:hypothetical protein
LHLSLIKNAQAQGINAAIGYDNRQIRLPKNQLVSSLLGCFDSDRIFLSKRLRELDAMLEELQEFEIKISDEGRESFQCKDRCAR